MSVQTGDAVPSGPASSRMVDRARFKIALWRTAPNPIWIRELRQAARLTRTPFILMAVTIFVTLVIAAVGGVLSDEVPSDKVGMATFHTFFSLAFFVVAWVGPALAANAIASEREGRTWEAVLLTGLRPEIIARGKFLAAYTAIGTYIVMMAPVGALSFLFGGVQALEIAIAFVYLFIFALLSVAFGLAISSKMASSRGAILITLLLAVPLSGFVYGLGGPALSAGVGELWPRVPKGPPVWLPTAYVRGDFGLEYLVLLFGLPAMLVVLPAWFLYEATVANLTGPNDDRSSGMKRWFIASSVVLCLTGVLTMVSVPVTDADEFAVFVFVVLGMFACFVAFVFTGEPIGPSRRVTAAWDRDRRGALHRFLGPGVIGGAKLQLVLLVATYVAVGVTSVWSVDRPVLGPMAGYHTSHPEAIVRFVVYATGFVVFVVGLSAWLRARAAGPAGARVLLLVVLAALSVVPWVVAAIGGVITRSDEALVIGSPSPFYAFVLLKTSHDEAVYLFGYIAAFAWTLIGFVLLGAASSKVKEVVGRFEATLAEAEAQLAREDAEIEAAYAAMAAAPPPPPEATFADAADAAHEPAPEGVRAPNVDEASAVAVAGASAPDPGAAAASPDAPPREPGEAGG